MKTNSFRLGLVILTLAATALPAAAQPPTAPPAPGPVQLDPIAQAVPLLGGLNPARQAEILGWMLGVGDDRRLVGLFPDLVETPVALGERAPLAREWAAGLMGSLERRGFRPATPPVELPLADAEPSAPPPNFFPPELMAELERAAARDSFAAEALAEARRARFDGPGGGVCDDPSR